MYTQLIYNIQKEYAQETPEETLMRLVAKYSEIINQLYGNR